MKVSVIGTGYVGLTTAVTLAYIGHKVVGVEKDREKLRLIQSFKSPIYEPGLEELMELCKDNLTFTDDPVPSVSDSEVIMIAVGTPSKPNGQTDLRYVETAAREIAEGLQEGRTYTLVIKSTVPIGTNRRVAYIVEQVINAKKPKDNIRVNVASNPEFLREGSAIKDMLYPDRIVVGSREPESVDILRRLYRPILEQTFEPPPFLPRPEGYDLPPFITTDPISAEMIKYAANAFLAMKISFINEIASLCEKVGADVTEVARGIGLDPRIGPRFLEAGLGWGGSCFPKDTAALVAMGKELSCPMRLVEAAREVNYRQRERAVERLQEVLKGVRGRIIGLLGLAFKPGTDDVRDSPSIDIIHMLLQREAHVRVNDPVAMDNARKVLQGLEVEFVDDPYEIAKGADALLLVTAWPQYRKLSLRKLASVMRTPILFDGRNFFEPEEARKAGFVYLGIGR